jgi:DNA-binding response OmpR family regulator
MHRLRQKLEIDPSNPVFLLTEPGLGYRLDNINAPNSET